MTTDLIVRTYETADLRIEVPFTSAAFFNATEAAKPFRKQSRDWLRNDNTQEYINAVGKILLIEQDQLVIVRGGAPETGGGTWFHPKLVIPFARWLDPNFAVWCDLQIDSILHGEQLDVAKLRAENSVLRSKLNHAYAKLARYEAEAAGRLPVRVIHFGEHDLHLCVAFGQPLVLANDLAAVVEAAGLVERKGRGERYPRTTLKQAGLRDDNFFVSIKLRPLMDAWDMTGITICKAFGLPVGSSEFVLPKGGHSTALCLVTALGILHLQSQLPDLYACYWQEALPALGKLPALLTATA